MLRDDDCLSRKVPVLLCVRRDELDIAKTTRMQQLPPTVLRQQWVRGA